MSMAGKRDGITRDDLLTVARTVGVKKAEAIIDQVRGALAGWPRQAERAGVPSGQSARVAATFRDLAA
jgi:serine/threonine-protein kinase HipA